MYKVDNQGWILINNNILNLSLIECIELSEDKKTIYICFNSRDFKKYDYDNEEIAKFEFALIKREIGFIGFK